MLALRRQEAIDHRSSTQAPTCAKADSSRSATESGAGYHPFGGLIPVNLKVVVYCLEAQAEVWLVQVLCTRPSAHSDKVFGKAQRPRSHLKGAKTSPTHMRGWVIPYSTPGWSPNYGAEYVRLPMGDPMIRHARFVRETKSVKFIPASGPCLYPLMPEKMTARSKWRCPTA
jgi:hypothetical protein